MDAGRFCWLSDWEFVNQFYEMKSIVERQGLDEVGANSLHLRANFPQNVIHDYYGHTLFAQGRSLPSLTSPVGVDRLRKNLVTRMVEMWGVGIGMRMARATNVETHRGGTVGWGTRSAPLGVLSQRGVLISKTD